MGGGSGGVTSLIIMTIMRTLIEYTYVSLIVMSTTVQVRQPRRVQ